MFIDFHKEYNFLLHSLTITAFSPLASLYQTSTLFNKPFLKNIRLVPNILPQQCLLRYGQLHVSTLCKDNLSPIAAFGTIGILQGLIYGHSNLYFSKKMGIIPQVSLKNYLKGPIFASSRDIISQGVPFAFSDNVRKAVFGDVDNKFTYYSSLMSTSLVSTFLSHPFHCLQTFNQNSPNMSQLSVAKEMIGRYGWSLFYRGIQGRIVLLFVTNLSNDTFLKSVWNRK